MFDTKDFGAFVAKMRKNADITQSELAEKLNLTRQAVSKYELGDSFPDISILIQIAEIFMITLDELVAAGKPTKGETRIIMNIPVKDDDDSIKINDLVNLAPLIKPSILSAYSRQLHREGIDISHIMSLVQYLNENEVLSLINSARFDSLDDELFKKITPFLDTASKEAILKKIIEGECGWSLIKVLLPHMENMAPLLEAAVMEGVLPKDVLEVMNNYFLREMKK